MKIRKINLQWLSTVCGATLLMLAACGGGGDTGTATDGESFIDTAGRLAVSEKDAKTVRMHDLDNANSVEASYQVDHVPSALYGSPQGRYAVVAQRLQDQVQFIDGGIWQEDHTNHLHDYKQPSKALAWKLTGPRPTHYDLEAGQQAAFFMDGNAAASPVQNAGVRLFDDNAIAAGQLSASMDLGLPIHGVSEPVGNKLLTVSRAPDALNTLPTHLDFYLRNGNSYSFSHQIKTRCDGMHGSFSSGRYTLVGCVDGMLMVRHTGTTTVDDGVKLATPLRVSTIAGHVRLPNHYIGIATEGATPQPVTTRFYAVDAAAGTVNDLIPQGWNTGDVRRAHGFDRTGQRFYILSNQGTLTVLQRQGAGWITAAQIPAVVPVMPSAAPWPVIVANGAKDQIYITDPVAQKMVVVSADTGAIVERQNLGYVPSGAAWLGITR
jgi:hypothetical protein